jgi:hypothetical protein
MPFPEFIIKEIREIIQKFRLSPDSMKSIFSSDTLDIIEKHKLAEINATKGLKEVFYNFFGMNKHWHLGRNITGMLMVHSPEYPTYFIPTYTQTKETGNSGYIKKNEGVRGALSGALEGIAIGALVSGEKLKPREMLPYIILGAALQYTSAKFFPWLGEKIGLYMYNLKSNKINPPPSNINLNIPSEIKNNKPLNIPLSSKKHFYKPKEQSFTNYCFPHNMKI